MASGLNPATPHYQDPSEAMDMPPKAKPGYPDASAY